MIVGDVVSQAVIRVDRPNANLSFKPAAGKVAMLLLLGDADKKNPDSFDGVKALNDLGWVKVQELEALKDLLTKIREEMGGEDPNLSILRWNEEFNKVL